MSRDKVASMLWPDSDAESAGHSLAQLLYSTRRVFSVDPIVTVGGALALRDDVISADVADFASAMAAGEYEQAVAVYAGPFLDGFHLPDSAELERWMTSERALRWQEAGRALDGLATKAARNKDRAAVLEWRRRHAVHDPLNGTVALRLMRALDDAGDAAGALRHARVHERLLREELDAPVDVEISRFADELRASSTAGPSLPAHTRVAAISADVGGSTADSLPVESDTAPSSGMLSAVPDPAIRRRSSAVRMAVSGAILLALLAGDWFVRRAPETESGEPSPMVTVAVLPFDVSGDGEFGYLADGMVDLLSANLDGAGDLRSVDPRSVLGFLKTDSHKPTDQDRAATVARHFGAQFFIVGRVLKAGGQLQIAATLYRVGRNSEVMTRAQAIGAPAQLFGLVDAVTAQLLVGAHGGPHEGLTRTATLSTRSIPALKQYLVGERHLRAGRYVPAVDAFQAAVSLDTTFALAYYRLSVAAEWAGQLDVEMDASSKAVNKAAQLTGQARQLVEALGARRRGAADEAEKIYRAVVLSHPDNVEGWTFLGEVLFHNNAYRGRSFRESRDAWTHVLALEPANHDALLHLTRVVARDGRRAELDSFVLRALPFASAAESLELRSVRAFAVGDKTGQDRVIADLQAAGLAAIQQSVWRVAVYTHNVEGAERIARTMLEVATPAGAAAEAHYALSMLLLARGQVKAAIAEGNLVPRLLPWSPRVGNPDFVALGFLPVDRAAIGDLRDRYSRLESPSPAAGNTASAATFASSLPIVRHYRVGVLSVRMNETSVALGRAELLDTMKVEPSVRGLQRLCVAIMRADAAADRGRPAEALAQLERTPVEVPTEVGGAFGVEPYGAWLRAESLHTLGRDAEAIAWYESRADLFINEMMYLAPSHLRRGEIFEALGNREQAVEHYQRFVDLWRTSDPELQGVVRKVEQRLVALGASPGGNQGLRRLAAEVHGRGATEEAPERGNAHGQDRR